MSLKAQIVGSGNSVVVKVTPSGELVVAQLRYDETEFNELDLVNTAYNFYLPKAGKQFVVTGIVAYGDKQVNTSSNATVVIYEATNTDVITVSKVLMQFEIGQNQGLPLTGLHILVKPGFYVNAKTDDDDVHITIMGYYIREL